MSSKRQKPNLIAVGAIIGAHGVRGDVKVKSLMESGIDAFSYGPLLDFEGADLLEVDSVRPAKTHFVVRPRNTRSREEWEGLKGTLLYIHRAALPETGEDEVYVDELIGVVATDPSGRALGAVKSVKNFGAGDLLEIQPKTGSSVYIPFTEQDVPEIDLSDNRLVIASWDLWQTNEPT